jgi:signal transduction histidine kinase
VTNGIARVPVLPRKVAADVTVFATTRGSWAIAAVTLLISIPGMVDLYRREGYPQDLALPLSAIVIMLLLIATMVARPSRGTLIAYVVVGAFCVYLLLYGALSEHPSLLPNALILLNRPATVLVLVGTVGSRPLFAVLWGVCGFLAGEGVTLLVSIQLGIPVHFGYGPVITLAFYSAAFVGLSFIQRAQRGRVPDFLRLRHETRRLEAVRTFDQRSVALLHDTVLNDLALVINGPEVLDASMRDRMLQDVATLARTDALAGIEPGRFADRSDASLRNQVDLLITDYQWRGLSVDVTGDSGAVVRVAPEVVEATVGALRACLENVLRHSGRDFAEIIVSATDTSITWTVSDDGVGFDVAAVPGDRLGLRSSVRQRVEAAGGAVKVFSAPAAGTSVLITLPLLGAPTIASSMRRGPGAAKSRDAGASDAGASEVGASDA